MGMVFLDKLDAAFQKELGKKKELYTKLVTDTITEAVNNGEIKNTQGLEKNIENVINLALRKGTEKSKEKIASINLAELIDFDAAELTKHIENLVDEFSEKGGKRTAKKLKTALMVADARGIDLKMPELNETAYVKELSRVSGMTADVIEDIQETLNSLNVNKATEEIRTVLTKQTNAMVNTLNEMSVQAKQKSKEILDDQVKESKEAFDKIKKNNQKNLEDLKKTEKEKANQRAKIADEKRADGAPGYEKTAKVQQAVKAEAQVVSRSQEAIRADIEATNKSIKNQKDWLESLSSVLDYDYSKSTRPAEQLRNATKNVVNYRNNPDEYKGIQYAEDRVNIRYWRAMEAAQKKNLKASTIAQYKTDIREDAYLASVNKLEEERAMRQKILQEETQKLINLQKELYTVETKAATGLDAYQKRYDFLKSAFESSEKALADAKAQEEKLEEEQARLMQTIEAASDVKNTAYDQAVLNTKKYNLTPDQLYEQALDHTQRGARNFDAEQAEKGVAYYHLYAEAMREVDQEMKRLIVDGDDLTDILLDNAKSMVASRNTDAELKQLKEVNAELVQVRENKAKLESEHEDIKFKFEDFAERFEAEKVLQGQTATDTQIEKQDELQKEYKETGQVASQVGEQIVKGMKEGAVSVEELQKALNSISQEKGTQRFVRWQNPEFTNALMQNPKGLSLGDYGMISSIADNIGNANKATQGLIDSWDSLHHTFGSDMLVIDLPNKMAKLYNDVAKAPEFIPQEYIKGVVDMNTAVVTLNQSEQQLINSQTQLSQTPSNIQDNSLNQRVVTENELGDAIERTAEKIREKAEVEKESESISDNSDAIAEEEKEKEAVDETKESINKKTAARKEEQSIGSNGEAAEQNRKEAEEAKAAADAYEKKEEAKRAEAAVQPEATRTTEDLTPLETQLDHINQLISKKNELFGQEESIVKGVAQSEADALKEVASQVENISTSSATSNTGKTEDLSPLEEQLIRINGLIDEKTDKFRTEEEVVAGAAKSEAGALDGISDSLSGISSAKDTQGSQENLTPLITQLTNVIELIMQKNSLFEHEATIVKGMSGTEVSALKEVEDALTRIRDFLENISDKKINISVTGLKKFTEDGLADKIESVSKVLQSLQDKEVSFDIQGINNINKLTKINVDDLDLKLTDVFDKVYDFTKAFNNLKIDDSSLLASIKQLMADGQKLKDLADVLRASKKQIKEAGKQLNGEKEKPSKQNLAQPYRDAVKLAKEYYDLLWKGNDATDEEKNRIAQIKNIWDALYPSVAKVTAELKKQGNSTSALNEFTKAYETGYQNYIQDQVKKLKVEDKSRWINENILMAPKEAGYSPAFKAEATELKTKLDSIKITDIVDQKAYNDLRELIDQFRVLQLQAQDFGNKIEKSMKVSNLFEEMSKYLHQWTGLSAETQQKIRALMDALVPGKVTKAEFAKIANEFNRIKDEARDAGEEVKSFWTKITEQITHKNAQLVATYLSFQDWVRYIRQAAQAVIELDSALTELRKVSDATTERLAQSFKVSAQTAQEMGSSVSSVINQTADWSRLGYSVDDAEKLARITTLFQTVGDNMTTESASEAMISTIKAFDMGVNQAEGIVDRYNEVANNFAIDTAGISTAIEKSGASLKAAGNDINQALGLIVAANDSLQNPDTVGQMLKTMSMRLRGASVADLEELGIDTTGMSQGKKSIVQQYKHMAGIDIMEGDRYKSTFQILDELHDKWETLSDAERAAITEATGGKRGGTVMSSLMQNWEDARETVKTAESAMGSAMREHENYAMSVQYSIDRLHASLQTLAYDVINSGALKSGADFLNGLIQGFDRLVKSVDGLVPIMATLFGTFYGFHSIVGVIEKVAVVLEKVRLGYEAAAAAKATDVAANATELASEKALLATKIKEILLNHQLAESQAEETATELADALANTADAQTERLLAIEKVKTILANKGLAEAQAAETATEIVDTMTNIGNAGSEGAVGASKLGAALAALGPVGMGAIAALAALAGTAYMVYQRNEQLKNSASELAGEYNTSKKEIENYKEKIAELHETLNDSNTSYEDAKAARQELLGIQDELIEKYGSEAGSINVVTKAINGQVDALDKLTDRKWQQTVNEFNKSEGLNVWSDFLNQLVHGADDNMGVMEQEMTNATVRIRGVSIDDKEFLKQMEEALGGEYEVDMNSGILTFSGDLDEARDKLYQIQDIANNLNVSSGLKRSITDEINSVDNTLNKYRDIYNQSVLYNDILPNYKDQYKQMLDAYEQYQNAIVDGNEKTVEAAKKNFGTVLNDINEAIKDDENKEHILDYFEDMYPELQEEIGKWKLEVKLNATTELDDDAKKDIYNQLANYSIGGNVDLTRRKPIDAKMLRDVGWEEAEGIATTYTSTYSNKAGTVAINFTPIFTKPNGEVDVLEPDALGEYAAGVIEGVHDDYLKLQIGAEFTGDNAIEQAVAAADEAHVLQEQYYLGERSNFNEAMSDIQQFANETELLAMQNDSVYQQATADQQLAWIRIKAEADNARMAVEDYISVVRSMGGGGLSNFDRSNNGIIGAGINKGASNDWERNNQSAMYSAMNSLDTDVYNDLILLSPDKLTQIRLDAQETAKELGVASLNTEQWVAHLQDAVNKEREAKALAEDIEEVSFSFAGFSAAKDELNNLGTLYKSIKEQMEKDPAKVRLDISEVEKLREKWKDVLGGDEAFDEFERKLTSSVTTAQEKIEILQEAAANFASQQFEIGGVDDETTTMIKEQLVDIGYLKDSVDAYVNSLRAEKTAEQEVNAIKANGGVVTAQNVANLRAQGEQLGLTGEALVKYIIEMMQANGLTISGDDSWLITLCADLDVAIDKIREYAGAANSIGSIKYKLNNLNYIPNGAPSEAHRAKGKSQLKFDSNSPVWGSNTKTGGGGGGGSKDAEKEKDILAELSKQLDEIQSAYSSLSGIVEEYNKNGKLTVDQAQELINTDFRYLAMLKQENGQLVLNEEGLQAMAKAKLHEMQIQLARNAIDTVNGLKTEADAVNFLTYAYEGLAGATLDATEQQLQFAVAAAKARGQAQGSASLVEAAERIWQGYQATKVAIGNTDFGADSLSGKKDSDKDKSDKDSKDKSAEEKDTKTKFNWLDRLVNKIQREIDKLSKRAEKYFNWAEKNALVDKQLAANKRMITTQQFAVDFYRNKTNKALKKVPKKYRNLVSGDFDPTTVKKIIAEVGSGKTKKLEEYLDWQELLEGAEDALAEAYEQERELINSKLENIMNYFDDLLDYQQSIIDNLDATNELLSAQGKFQSIDTFLKSLGGQRDKYGTVGERNAEYDKAANEARRELADSYENQVEDVKKSYESSSAYNKLAKKKNLGGWQAEALQFIRDNNIQAEDVEDVLKQYKIYYKNRNKTGKQKNKADDAYKKLQEAADRAADSLGDLTKEQDEQQKLIERNAEKQKQQNEADAKQTEIDYWNNLRNLFDLMTQELDAQIRMLNTITEKYTTIYDLLDSVELADLKKYNVDDVFGIDVYGEQSKAVALRNAIESLKDSIDVYHEKFNFYGELIEVLTGTPEQVEAGIKRMLSSYDLSEEAQKYLDQIAKDLAENGFDNLNSIVQDVNENYEATRKQIADSITSSENMSKKLLDAITDQTDKLIEALTSAQQAYASRSALINDEWTVDKNGITEYGYAKIGNLNKEADMARQTALYYNKQIADLEADTTVDKESTEYKVKLNDYIKKYYDAVKSVHSINDEIYNIAQKAMQNEVDNISKLVDNYKKALNAKKAYYDYNKQIKEKNKNIQSLKAEAAALENVADQASKARLKQIQAELEEAQEDLDDTVFNHQVQVETDALDKLIADMTEALNDVGETIEETFEKWSQTVKDVVGVALGYNIDDIFNKIIDFDMNGAIDEETLAKEIAAAEAEKQKKVDEQNKKKSNAEAQIETLKSEISSINSKYNTKLSHSGETVRNTLTQVMNSDKLATQYADKIIAERKAEQEKLKAEGKGVSTIGMVGAGTSKYDWQQLYNNKKKALENAYNTARKDYDNLAAQRDAEIAKVQEKIKTYEEAVTVAEAEIKKLQNATVVSTQTPTATAPATTGTSTVPSSVATDAQQGKYTSIQTIGEDTSAINTSLSGISENVIKLLSKSTDLYKFATDTQKPYMTTIQKQISSLTTNVSTIATNTTNISTQLTNINSSVKTVADNVKSNSNYGTYNVWNDGTYWYEGMKRMGKMVTYH